jgi:hypothetical protein
LAEVWSAKEKRLRSPVVSEEGKVKVTDKRLFTPDGELREEYRSLGESTPAAEEKGNQPEAPERPAAAPSPQPPVGEAGAASSRPEAPPLELPHATGGYGAPSFLDLLSVLAEPVAVYLGDAKLPDGSSAENLQMARLYIDMIELLRRKTVGHLTAQESAVLEDVLYRLKMRYVQKRG